MTSLAAPGRCGRPTSRRRSRGTNGFRLLVVQVEEVAAGCRAPISSDVAEALGGDQAGLDALALGQRVDHDRRAVGEETETRNVDVAPCRARRARRARNPAAWCRPSRCGCVCRPLAGSVSVKTRSVNVPPTSVQTRARGFMRATARSRAAPAPRRDRRRGGSTEAAAGRAGSERSDRRRRRRSTA